MGCYRKKPVVIEAWQNKSNDVELWPAWLDAAMKDGTVTAVLTMEGEGTVFVIDTLEGEMIAKSGDWIIRGVKGELYPCKPDIFEATYEAVEDRPTGEDR